MSTEMKMASSKKEKMRPKILDAIRLKRSANAGHIVRHEYDNGGPGIGYHEPEEFTFGPEDGDKVLAHVAEHMGITSAKEEKGEKEHRAGKGTGKSKSKPAPKPKAGAGDDDDDEY